MPDTPAEAACTGWSLASGYACESPVVITVTAGCEHEHIGDRQLCQYHVADIAHGLMVCGDCYLVDGHRCVLVAVREVAHA